VLLIFKVYGIFVHVLQARKTG